MKVSQANFLDPERRSARGVEGAEGTPASNGESSGAAKSRTDSERATSESLLRLGGEAADAARRLIDLVADRAWFAMRRSLLRAALAVVLGVGIALWVGASILAVFRGVCDAIAAWWGGPEWIGQLAGGLAGIAVALGGLLVAIGVDKWWQLRRLESKYQATHSSDEAAQSTERPQ